MYKLSCISHILYSRMHLLCVVLILCGSSFVFAQTTSKELGEKVFNAFKTEDISGFDSLLPTFEEVLVKVRDLGMIQSDEEMNKFEQEYILSIEKYKSECQRILDVGRKDMITWSETVLDSIITKKEYIQMEDTEPPVILASTIITINFSYKYWQYQLLINGAFESNGKMKLGSDKIEFYEF